MGQTQLASPPAELNWWVGRIREGRVDPVDRPVREVEGPRKTGEPIEETEVRSHPR